MKVRVRGNIFSAMSLFLLLMMAATVHGETVAPPEFDGIYLRMKDGSHVRLPVSDGRGTVSVQLHSGMSHTNALMSAFFTWDDLANFPQVNLLDVGPIVIVGPPPRELFVSPLVEIGFVYPEHFSNPVATATYYNGTESVDIPASELPPILMRQACGYTSLNMNVKRVSNSVTEFQLRNLASWPSQSLLTDCTRLPIKAVGFEVQVDGRFYASFVSLDGRIEAFQRWYPVAESAAPLDEALAHDRDGVPLGRFVVEPAMCGEELVYSITFEEDSIKFYEHSCKIESHIWNNELEITGQCDGEGATYRDTLSFNILDENSFMYNGETFTRCN